MQQAQLNNSKVFKVWEKIEIIVGEGAGAGRYTSRIEDFINNGIIITKPEFVEGNTLLREGADVTVLITREDAVYQFHSVIKQSFTKNRKHLILTPPRKIERVQRRLFVRVELAEIIYYARLDPKKEWEELEENLVWEKTYTIDLSGGGMLFVVDDDVKSGDILLLKINFFKSLELPEMVCAQARRVATKGEKRCCGVEYILSENLLKHFKKEQILHLPGHAADFDSHYQNKLVNFVFQKQIEFRQKGLI